MSSKNVSREKIANSLEYMRLENVREGRDPCEFVEKKKDPLTEERIRAVNEKIARKNGFIT